jgi:hypothetical protein
VTDVHLVICSTLGAPDPDTPRVQEALVARGVDARAVDWRDASVQWGSAPLTIVRSPWDYVDHLDEFRAWVEHVDAVSTLWNPAATIQWNVHKSYLLELDAAGAPIVPTVLVPQGVAAHLDGVLDAQGWNAAVVKPAVSVGAIGAGRFDVGDPAAQAHFDGIVARGDVLVQEYQPSVEVDGEMSVVWIDGEVTHAVRKTPKAGDYRVHAEYGGRAEIEAPTDGLADLARRVVALAPTPLLYARVDAVRARDGWALMELEVVEPFLWLDGRPDLVDRFVDAVIARLGLAA